MSEYEAGVGRRGADARRWRCREPAYHRFMLSHSQNEGCTNVGCLDGTGEAHVGKGWGGQWRARWWSHGNIVRHVRRAFKSSIESLKVVVVVVAIRCRDPDHRSALPPDLFHPPTASVQSLLPFHENLSPTHARALQQSIASLPGCRRRR